MRICRESPVGRVSFGAARRPNRLGERGNEYDRFGKLILFLYSLVRAVNGTVIGGSCYRRDLGVGTPRIHTRIQRRSATSRGSAGPTFSAIPDLIRGIRTDVSPKIRSKTGSRRCNGDLYPDIERADRRSRSVAIRKPRRPEAVHTRPTRREHECSLSIVVIRNTPFGWRSASARAHRRDRTTGR